MTEIPFIVFDFLVMETIFRHKICHGNHFRHKIVTAFCQKFVANFVTENMFCHNFNDENNFRHKICDGHDFRHKFCDEFVTKLCHYFVTETQIVTDFCHNVMTN